MEAEGQDNVCLSKFKSCLGNIKNVCSFFWDYRYEIIGLLNCMIGSLLIHLPRQADKAGWLATFVGITIAGIFNYASCYFYIIHQHFHQLMGTSFQEHFNCRWSKKCIANVYNITIFINIFLLIIQYLKLLITLVNFLFNITDPTSQASTRVEFSIMFFTFIIIFLMVYYKRNIKIMAWTFVFSILIYCFYLIGEAIGNSRNRPMNLDLFNVVELSSISSSLTQGFTIQYLCFEFLKRSDKFQQDPDLPEQLKRNNNNQEYPSSAQYLHRNLPSQENRQSQVEPRPMINNSKHNQIILFTYVLGYIVYLIMGFVGNFMIEGRQKVLGLNANVDDTILHYYRYNSYEGIIICVLVLLHFIPTYPEYVLITVDLFKTIFYTEKQLKDEKHNLLLAEKYMLKRQIANITKTKQNNIQGIKLEARGTLQRIRVENEQPQEEMNNVRNREIEEIKSAENAEREEIQQLTKWSEIRIGVNYFKDIILIFGCVMINTIINHFLVGISLPFFIEINGSIFSYIFLFLIPMIEHFSECSPTVDRDFRRQKCIYLQRTYDDDAQELQNKLKNTCKYRWLLNILVVLMNIFGLLITIVFFLKLTHRLDLFIYVYVCLNG